MGQSDSMFLFSVVLAALIQIYIVNGDLTAEWFSANRIDRIEPVLSQPQKKTQLSSN